MTFRPFALSDGSLEALKWLALVAMTIDHVNAFIFGRQIEWMYAVGRLAMPLFALVLACQLARPHVLTGQSWRRMSWRLALFGALATPVFVPLFASLQVMQAGVLPLNILFSFLLAVLCVKALSLQSPWMERGAVVLFAATGLVVEYWWIAPGLVIAGWWYQRQPCVMTAVGVLLALILLCFLNDNVWALLVLPLIALAMRWPIVWPRWRLLFYVYYPVHLLLILGIRHVINHVA